MHTMQKYVHMQMCARKQEKPVETEKKELQFNNFAIHVPTHTHTQMYI